MNVTVLVSRVWLCDPRGCSPPGSPVLGFSRQECRVYSQSFLRGVVRPSLLHCGRLPHRWRPGRCKARCCCCFSHWVVSDSLQPHGPKPPRLLRPWDFPGKNTGSVAISFSQGLNCVSCIGRQFLYHWATRESPQDIVYLLIYFKNMVDVQYSMLHVYSIAFTSFKGHTPCVAMMEYWPCPPCCAACPCSVF